MRRHCDESSAKASEEGKKEGMLLSVAEQHAVPGELIPVKDQASGDGRCTVPDVAEGERGFFFGG